MKLSKKQKVWTVLAVIILSVVILFSWLWYRENYTGERTGQVIDALTGEPIEGAVVNYTWHVAGFMENAIGGGGPTVSHETLTDKEGKYHIPSLRIKRSNIFQLSLEPERVLVYKDKYVAYIVDLVSLEMPVLRPLGYPDDRQIYHRKNNIVKLYPWKDGESHDRHLRCIGMRSPERNKLLLNELKPEEERAREENLRKHGGKNE